MEAAKLLQDLAAKAAAQKVHPLRVKKLYVLAAFEVRACTRSCQLFARPRVCKSTVWAAPCGYVPAS